MIALDFRPDRKKLREFGVLAFFVFGGLAALTWVAKGPGVWLASLGSWVVPLLCAVAISSLAFSVVFPSGNRPLYVGLMLVGYPVGIVISYTLLAVLFFGVIGPVSVGLRIARRGHTLRTLDPRLGSYWSTRTGERSVESYFRQF